jgi:hypothetical protein
LPLIDQCNLFASLCRIYACFTNKNQRLPEGLKHVQQNDWTKIECFANKNNN